jgi:hypothetical protein
MRDVGPYNYGDVPRRIIVLTHATCRLSVRVEIRPHVRAALAARRAGEPALKIGVQGELANLSSNSPKDRLSQRTHGKQEQERPYCERQK